MLRTRAIVGALAAMLAVGVMAAPATADDDTGTSGSVTVSWEPQDRPALIRAGEPSTSHFWVTNTSPNRIGIVIDPATAVPRDNGQLEIIDGPDRRFDDVVFSPSEFAIEPGGTVQVDATVTPPEDLPPGVYLLPAVVRPDLPPGDGNIQIRTAVVALTTFQLEGGVDIDVAATLALTGGPRSIVRTLPPLPTIVLGDRGAVLLSVRSDSSQGIYTYYEVVSESQGIGRIAFDEHTQGAIDDIRGLPQLYFPGTGREHVLGWSTVPFAVGAAAFGATVLFNPDPQTIGTVSASASFIVVSPWWLAALLAALVVVLVRSDSALRRAARASRSRRTGKGARSRRRAREVAPPSQVGCIVGTIVFGLLLAAIALFADYLVLGVIAALGIVLVIVSAGLLRRRTESAIRAVRWFLAGAALLILVSVGLLFATALLGWSLEFAVAVAAAATIWTIAVLWLTRNAAKVVVAAGAEPDAVAEPPELV